MKNSELIISIKHISKVVFLAFTVILIFAYSVALNEKICRPSFKNLPTNEFIIIGLILLVLIYINLKWFTKILLNKTNGGGNK